MKYNIQDDEVIFLDGFKPKFHDRTLERFHRA